MWFFVCLFFSCLFSPSKLVRCPQTSSLKRLRARWGGQLTVLEGSLVVRMHRGVGLTSLQGDHISFSGMRLSYCPAKRCPISGSLAIPSTFIYFLCRCAALQVALSDAGALFLLDYTNAGGNVIKVGRDGSKSIPKKRGTFGYGGFAEEFLGKPPSGHTSACGTRKFSMDLHQFDE